MYFFNWSKHLTLFNFSWAFDSRSKRAVEKVVDDTTMSLSRWARSLTKITSFQILPLFLIFSSTSSSGRLLCWTLVTSQQILTTSTRQLLPHLPVEIVSAFTTSTIFVILSLLKNPKWGWWNKYFHFCVTTTAVVLINFAAVQFCTCRCCCLFCLGNSPFYIVCFGSSSPEWKGKG